MYMYVKCNVIILWSIYKDDCATGHMHTGKWYDKLVAGKTAMTVLDNNMDKVFFFNILLTMHLDITSGR